MIYFLARIIFMSIRVKCFAGLRERLGVDCVEVDYRGGMTVGDVWGVMVERFGRSNQSMQSMQSTQSNQSNQSTQSMQVVPAADVLCARNLEYTNFSQVVADGDEVAFFPQVTGG